MPEPITLTFDSLTMHYQIRAPYGEYQRLKVIHSVNRNIMLKWSDVHRVLNYVCRRALLEGGYPVEMKKALTPPE